MSKELVPVRFRVALPPRPAGASSGEARAPRVVEALYVETDKCERFAGAVLVELHDGAVTEVLVADPTGGGDSLAALPVIAGPPGSVVAPRAVCVSDLCRHVERRCGKAGAALVVFDVRASAGRLAAHSRRLARGSGVSIALVGCGWFHREHGRWMDSDYRRRLALVTGGAGRVFARWQPPRKKRRTGRGGPVIQLDVLGTALGHAATTQAGLVSSLGQEWPSGADAGERLVRRGLQMAECYRRLAGELAQVAPGLSPHRCWSAGSISTHALRRAGVRSPAATTTSLPAWVVGAIASAMHGPEATAAFIGVPGPMALVDLNRTFLRMFSLAGLTSHLACHHFEVVEADPADIERFLGSHDLRSQLDDRATWRRWSTTFVLVEPQGENLPVHRKADEHWRSVTAPFDFCGGAVWLHAFDLFGPALHGCVPRILRRFSIQPAGTAPDLGPVRMPSGALVDLSAADADWGRACEDERDVAAAIADPLARSAREQLAKGFGVAGCWGNFGRTDQLSAPRPVVVTTIDGAGKERKRLRYLPTVLVEATGPRGEHLVKETERPEVAGPLALDHINAAIPAACRAIMAIATYDLAQIGCTVAATMTDALVIALGDAHREQVRQALARFDGLLCPAGGGAWKEEITSLTEPTLGVVLGVNKVLLGRTEEGRFVLVRSTDTQAGEHFLDPTGTGDLLRDGRTAWGAALEEPLFEAAVPTGEVRVPGALPAWADDRPAMRPRRAATFEQLQSLRSRTGCPTLQPGCRYLVVAGFEEGGPVCLGADHDPAQWRDLDWRADGVPCRVGILGADGDTVASKGTGRIFIGATHRDVLRSWLQERDPTMEGPRQGLRHPALVRSHPALVELVGRVDTWSADRDADPADAEVYGEGDVVPLVDGARALGTAVLAARGLAPRTADRVVAGKGRHSSRVLAKTAAAIATGPVERRCQGPGCTETVTGRRDKRFCTNACRMAAQRAPMAPSPAATDVVCARCGCVLLGAAAHGACPACGHVETRP